MSKTKEQCLNIISKQFSNIEEKKDIEEKLSILEESIKEIVESEYSFVWKYDSMNNKIIHRDKTFLLVESILKLTTMNKKVFFDNHITSHKNYNKLIDNPLDIQLKSMIVLPLFQNEKLLGFLVAYNSFNYGSDFQRYDTRSIGLLTKQSEKLLMDGLNQKRVLPIKLTPKINKKTKKELETELKEQSEKIKELELLLAEERKLKEELVVVEEVIELPREYENHKELNLILNFLNNELSYFSEKENHLYTLLELIKNSLHNKEQVSYIENQLKSSQLVNNLIDSLQNREKMSLNKEAFKTYKELLSVVNLYTKVFAQEELFFNLFIDPNMPSELLGDIEKIQSLLVHLLNNINGLTRQYGRVELSIKYNRKEELLGIVVKCVPPEERKNFFDFFKKKKVTNSLTTNNLGLGLSVASNLINLLNGKLKLITEDNGKHTFMVSLPCSISENIKQEIKSFKAKKPLKIAILMSSDDEYEFYNFRGYLAAFGIKEENIILLNNHKKLEGKNFSHLFCFEKMFSDKIDVSKISSVTILTYNRRLGIEEDNAVNELYVNAYYGMSLQEILFPHIPIEEIGSNTILLECNRIKKDNEKKNKELNSYVGQLRGFKA